MSSLRFLFHPGKRPGRTNEEGQTLGMTNDESRVKNEGILSIYIGIIAIDKIKLSDFHHSKFVIRQLTFENRHSYPGGLRTCWI